MSTPSTQTLISNTISHHKNTRAPRRGWFQNMDIVDCKNLEYLVPKSKEVLTKD